MVCYPSISLITTFYFDRISIKYPHISVLTPYLHSVFGYVNNDFSNVELQKKKLFVEVEKQKYPIKLNLKPLKQTNYKNI